MSSAIKIGVKVICSVGGRRNVFNSNGHQIELEEHAISTQFIANAESRYVLRGTKLDGHRLYTEELAVPRIV
jgi:hypothetical protein